MNPEIQSLTEACAKASLEGTLNFGQIVGQLVSAGVESYHADYRRSETTYYMPDGSSHSVAIGAHTEDVGLSFDKEEVQQCIRGAQRGEVKYPEFVARTMKAGCVGYVVWIAGRHVQYFGRHGEVHVEHFPSAP